MIYLPTTLISNQLKKKNNLLELENQLEREIFLPKLHHHSSTEKLKIRKQEECIDWYEKYKNIFIFEINDLTLRTTVKHILTNTNKYMRF